MSEINDEAEKRSDVQETFKERLKRSLLQVYFELMKERAMTVQYGAVLFVIMTLQLIGYFYYRKIDIPFKDDLFSTIANILDLVRVFPAVESAKNTELYLAVFFLMMIFLNLYIAMYLFVDYSISIGKFYFRFPVQFLMTMSSLLIWVLITPMTEMLISIFKCDGEYHEVMTNTLCWNGAHIFYCILAILCLIEIIIISLCVSIFYNETRFTSSDALARLDTNFELYLLIYRIFLAIISVYGTTEVFEWILAAVHFFGSFNFVKMYFKYLPYYNSKISIIFGTCLCSYCWVSFNLVISLMLESLEYTGQSIVIILGIIIILPLVKSLREKAIFRMLFEYRYDKIKEEFSVFYDINY